VCQLLGRVSARYHCPMFIGDRRTKHSIRAFRSPGEAVLIPKGAILRDVRTNTEPGYPFPSAMKGLVPSTPTMHTFEYGGETLYMRFPHGLMDATSEIKAE
jgi:hypothetical protein